MGSPATRVLPLAARAMRPALPGPAAAFVAAGAVVIAVYFVLPVVAKDVLYVVVGVASATAVIVGSSRYVHAGERPAWRLFALGILLLAAGDAIFSWNDIVSGSPPSLSVADVLYLAAYPIMFAGIVVLLWRPPAVASVAAIVDVAIVSTAFALAQWVFLIDPYRNDPSLTLTERAVAMSYPAVDVLLLAGFAQLVVRPAWRTWSFHALFAGVLLMLVGDEIYSATLTSYASGAWVDAFWLAAYVLWGAAALDPAAAGRDVPARQEPPRLTRARVAMLAAAIVTAPIVLVLERVLGNRIHAYELAVSGGILSALVLARLAGLVLDIDRARAAEHEAREEAERAQRLLSEQNERLLELDRLKDEFVSLVSHDLRTPLTSISGYVELLQEKRELDQESRGFLTVVERNTGRLLRLVADLLFVARVSAGGLALEVAEVDLARTARDSVSAIRPRAAAAEVSVDLLADEPVLVRGEPGRLAQLLDNLVSNAVKFTPVGGRVAVSVRADGERAMLEVADTGIGIPEDERERLFDRFYRSPAAVARQIQGTGLGLHIAKAIVDAHGGEIAVAARRGGGTVFRIELPALYESRR